MDSSLKNQFLRLWETYFPGCELPIAFYYDTHPHALPLVKPPQGHRCLLAQLHKVRNGESLCFTPESVGCGGGKRYLGYAETIRPDFEYFLSHGKEGQPCERYKRTPEQVTEILSKLPLLPRTGGLSDLQEMGSTGRGRPAGRGVFPLPAGYVVGLIYVGFVRQYGRRCGHLSLRSRLHLHFLLSLPGSAPAGGKGGPRHVRPFGP